MKIEKLPSGNRRARVSYYENGIRKQKSFTAPTAAEVKKLALEFEVSVANTSASRSLKNACISYISSRSNILSPSTIIGYKKTIRNEFQPLMDKDVNRITSKDLQKCVNEMSSRISHKTIKNHLGFVLSVLRESTNNTYKVDLPQKAKKEVYIPSEEDVRKLIEIAQGEMRLIIMMGAYMGLRRGEISAITNEDIDEGHHTLSISKAKVFDGKKDVVKTPKTYSSYRTLDIPDIVWAEIEPKLSKGEKIITLSLSSITHRYQRLIAKSDCPHFSFHKLRHFYVSKMVAMGVPLLYLKKMSGHSTDSLANAVYQHIMSSEEKKVRELIKNNITKKD